MAYKRIEAELVLHGDTSEAIRLKVVTGACVRDQVGDYVGKRVQEAIDNFRLPDDGKLRDENAELRNALRNAQDELAKLKAAADKPADKPKRGRPPKPKDDEA